MSKTVPVLLVVLASVFGFLTLIIVIINLCSVGANDLKRVFTNNMIRFVLMILTTAFAYVLFGKARVLVREELENIA